AYLETLVDAVSYSSNLFSNTITFEDALSILTLDEYKGPQGLALRELYTLWLNLANDALISNTVIDLGDLSTAGTVGEAILECEQIMLEPGNSARDFLIVLRICQEINAGRYE
ncbi:MAG: hypothetical protein ACFFCP_12605, partial [Promethearchaeota archaeon]